MDMGRVVVQNQNLGYFVDNKKKTTIDLYMLFWAKDHFILRL